MQPSLPHRDPDVLGRKARLEAARHAVSWSWDTPPGVASAASVPKGHGYSAELMAKGVALAAELKANRVAASAEAALRGERGETASSPASCRAQLALLESPPVVGLGSQGPAMRDRVFAWLRVGGANPLELARMTARSARLPVDDSMLRAALGADDSLDAALGEGRLYLADWRRLDGLRAGSGRALCAPMALFGRPRVPVPGVPLVPIALQCGQEPAPRCPLLTPSDPRWSLGVLAAQAADANVHELFHHLGRAHFVMEAIAVATLRCLSDAHPIAILLAPHLEGTIAINASAKSELVAPGHEIDRLLAPRLEDALGLVAAATSSVSIDDLSLPRDLARRGLDDREALPEHPWRDEATPLWDALARFVSAYLGLYYADDGALAADPELADWAEALRREDGGRLRALPGRPESRDALAELLTSLVFLASVQHSTLNYAQYEVLADASLMPLATWDTPPTEAPADVDAAWARALPSRALVADQVDFAYRQSRIRVNRLGDVPRDHFADPRAAELQAGLRTELDALDRDAAQRDARRLLPQPWLRARNVAASIHI